MLIYEKRPPQKRLSFSLLKKKCALLHFFRKCRKFCRRFFFFLCTRLVAGSAHSGSVSPSCSDLAAVPASYHATLKSFFFYADI